MAYVAADALTRQVTATLVASHVWVATGRPFAALVPSERTGGRG
ncbi:hypothetical protein [Mycobacterium shigaense]|uniref:Uncharacterized protein n=1 Tax=Mycobacterium shigaense TaxID=722731 RepID=A0A1Z4EJF8_9MYCO|nr:hypothetical protein [Mycobacterium shigaense]MEA1124865.1 hypothetical protein [Mycobacterium shigaense]BAX93091.1 hypothetical protein MSG_02950 [Mycobacterium shigaense]